MAAYALAHAGCMQALWHAHTCIDVHAHTRMLAMRADCMHARMHARTHAHICTHGRTHARTHAHTHARTHAVHMHARTHARIRTHARTHAYARMHARTQYVCTHMTRPRPSQTRNCTLAVLPRMTPEPPPGSEAIPPGGGGEGEVWAAGHRELVSYAALGPGPRTSCTPNNCVLRVVAVGPALVPAAC